ncbi:hypothetical protein F5Y16DRAFT_424622 [Xylariaceae sp. FL0255]|nr:hypothetical protein F5Y16DRAFT_424622 [Xylariaceae sp. FL0255]
MSVSSQPTLHQPSGLFIPRLVAPHSVLDAQHFTSCSICADLRQKLNQNAIAEAIEHARQVNVEIGGEWRQFSSRRIIYPSRRVVDLQLDDAEGEYRPGRTVSILYDTSRSPVPPDLTPDRGINLFTQNRGLNTGQNVFAQNRGLNTGHNLFNQNRGLNTGRNLFTQNRGLNTGQNAFAQTRGLNAGQSLFPQNSGLSNGQKLFNQLNEVNEAKLFSQNRGLNTGHLFTQDRASTGANSLGLGIPPGLEYGGFGTRKRSFSSVNSSDPAVLLVPHPPSTPKSAGPHPWPPPPPGFFSPRREGAPSPPPTTGPATMPGAFPLEAEDTLAGPRQAPWVVGVAHRVWNTLCYVRDSMNYFNDTLQSIVHNGLFNAWTFTADRIIFRRAPHPQARLLEEPETLDQLVDALGHLRVLQKDGTPTPKRPRLSKKARRLRAKKPDFNWQGHFSLDLIESSDDEDGPSKRPAAAKGSAEKSDVDQPRTPRKSSSPEPYILQSPPPNEVQFSNSKTWLDQNVPPSDINRHRTNYRWTPYYGTPTKIKHRRQRSTGRAATRNGGVGLAHQEGAVVSETQERRPTLETAAPVTPSAEGRRASTVRDDVARQSPKMYGNASYRELVEFFNMEEDASLPELKRLGLSGDPLKMEHIKRLLRERIGQEEIDSQNAALAHLGVRRPRLMPIVQKLAPEWERLAQDAPINGRVEGKALHRTCADLQPRDFAKLVPETAWLNDDIIYNSLCCIANYVNEAAGVKDRVDAPKCVAFTSLYWKTFIADNKKVYPRTLLRGWNLTPQNFHEVETILVPINDGVHWTVMVVRPQRKEIAFLDSFRGLGINHLDFMREWLRRFLGESVYIDKEWRMRHPEVPPQSNSYDCGVFVITNSMLMSLGIDPLSYSQNDMKLQRLRIAAMLMNRGFSGEFSLSGF